MLSHQDLLTHLARDSRVRAGPRLKAAFAAIDRAQFVAPDFLSEAYADYPLHIGAGQTISQPTTVAFMLGLLATPKGARVLDVGSGSGWTAALLAHLVGERGSVLGLERIPSLVALGRRNLARYRFPHARIERAGETLGSPRHAPFDRILVSAAAEREATLAPLLAQLAPGGVLVAPVGNAIVRLAKGARGGLRRAAYPGFAFVPLVADKA
jgi:protein-L-isoaspartate(D-aspartate) O-methyltransferase